LQQLAKVLVEDYPFHSNPFFSYAVPADLEKNIKFGSLVQVPFGLSNTLRFGIVLELSEKKTHELKSIYALIIADSPLNHDTFSYLLMLSSTFVYPLSLLFGLAGIFPRKNQTRIYYQWTKGLLEEVGASKEAPSLISYIEKHPDGFFEDLVQHKMKWKKTNLIFKKLQQSSHINKTVHVSYPDNELLLSDPGFSGVKILNGMTMEQRLLWLEKLIIEKKLKKVLLVVPSKLREVAIEKFFASSSCLPVLEIRGKQALLKIDQRYSLIFIEDAVHMGYAWDMPFSYSIEKTVLFRSIATQEAIVLASYIPGLTTYYHLSERVFSHIVQKGNLTNEHYLPKLNVLSMNVEIKEHGYSVIPHTVLRRMDRCLDHHGKIFLMLNRKGFYNYILCRNCGYVARCPDCKIVLSSSIDLKHVFCRYCRYTVATPDQCPECKHIALRYHAPGTQKIEDLLLKRFYGKRIVRLDKDSTNEKLQITINSGNFDIVVGTIYAMEHLDFKKIDLCVWLGLDSILNYPGFSSEEKALALFSRIYEKLIDHKNQKELIVPSFSAQSELLRAIRQADLGRYYKQMLHTRKLLSYPPYQDWVAFDIGSHDEKHLEEQLKALLTLIKQQCSLKVKSQKRILPGKAGGKKAYSLLMQSSEIIESSTFLGNVLDEYKKNEKITCKIKVLD
jgi:primosomal protein N'